MQNIAAIQTNTAQLGEGNANIAYEFGHLHLAPPGEFIGGAVQSYYEQGYNNQDYQYQPPRKIRDRRTFSYHSFSLFL
jgi:hypothetical protein